MGYSRGDDAIEYAQQSGRAGHGNNNPQGFSFFSCLDSGGSRLDLSITPKDGKEALLHFLYTQGCHRKVLHGYLDRDSRPCLQGDRLINGYDTQDRLLVFFVGRYARGQNSGVM